MTPFKTAAFALLVSLVLVACGETSRPELALGTWRAWLDSPGGELPFGLEFEGRGDGLRAWLVNGAERIEVERVELGDRTLLLGIDHYDSAIHATLGSGGRELEGRWSKTAGPDETSTLAFHATAGGGPRFPGPRQAAERSDVSGRWAVDFSSDENPAVGIFDMQGDGTVLGTFLTSTGDYRYLAGSFTRGRLRLSCFDGAHAFLFDATLQADGSLAGNFWSRDSWHETWTAHLDPEARLLDPFAQTRWVAGAELDRVRYPDLDGRLRALGEPELSGRARLLVVFGTWCPNCNDSSRYFVELHERYRGRGLAIVGLAFEMTGSFERDAEQVRKYVAYHGIQYPVLLAGTSDKEAASAAFALIDRVRSYPTTIFLDEDNRVRGVYSGFSGPATGEAYEELRSRFEGLIEEMLPPGQGTAHPTGA